MEVIACKRCGKIFQIVKQYLRENRGATMEEVRDATGASIALIQRFLREGRLEVAPESPIALSCERCGIKIYTGRFCERCQVSRAMDFEKAAKEIDPKIREQKKEKERMRFLNQDK